MITKLFVRAESTNRKTDGNGHFAVPKLFRNYGGQGFRIVESQALTTLSSSCIFTARPSLFHQVCYIYPRFLEPIFVQAEGTFRLEGWTPYMKTQR